MLDVVSMFDVDWMKGQSAGLYTLRNSTPEDVIKELQNVFEAEGPGKGLVRFQAITRLNAILAAVDQVEVPGADRDLGLAPRSRRLGGGKLLRLSRGERAGQGSDRDPDGGLHRARGAAVRGAEESEVAPTESASRQTTASNSSFDEGTSSSSAQPAAATGSSAAPTSHHTPSSSASSPLALSSGGLEAGAGSQETASQVRIIPDERNNKLLIKASGRDLRKILSILRRIDQPPMQVLINATLAEVTLNDNLQVRRAVLPGEEQRQRRPARVQHRQLDRDRVRPFRV